MKQYPFTVEFNGKTYDCERLVTGERVLRQTVRVAGVGSKNDPASYAKNRYHPLSTMESMAKIIAQEILKGI